MIATTPGWRWLDELRRFPSTHQQLVFEEQKRTIRQIEARVTTMDAAIVEAVGQWRFGPVVDALRCLRGVDTVIAATLVAEIGDIGWKAQTRLCGMSGIDHQRCRSMPTRSSSPR